jgi:drug/metabolite transporter superfamily protein YnfA
VAALLFAGYALWKKRESNLAPAALTPIVVIAWLMAKQTGDGLVPFLSLNFFMLALGVYTLLRGIRSGRVFEANLGMVVIAALATARFFDTDLEFVVRGIAFILIGLGFLVTNLIVFKRKARG